MEDGVERRAARRFSMLLPLKVRFSAGSGITEKQGETRDVSFRGLYFLIEAVLETGSSIEFVLTLPQQITLALEHLVKAVPAVQALWVGARGFARLGQIEFHSIRIHEQKAPVRLREILEHRQPPSRDAAHHRH